MVLVPPSIASTAQKEVTVKEGGEFTLNCTAQGYPNPNVTWVRINGKPLPDGKLRHEGSSLRVTNVHMQDRGIFRCLADNAVRPPAVFDTAVNVYFRPRSFPIQTSYGQAANRMFDVIIECRISGYPEPDLQWYKENFMSPINDDDKHAVNILLNHANILGQHEKWFQLLIRTVTANDFGTYLCAGSNMYGLDAAEIVLFETSECQGPNCPEEQVPEGRDAASLSSVTWWTLLASLFFAFRLKKSC